MDSLVVMHRPPVQLPQPHRSRYESNEQENALDDAKPNHGQKRVRSCETRFRARASNFSPLETMNPVYACWQRPDWYALPGRMSAGPSLVGIERQLSRYERQSTRTTASSPVS